MTSNDNNGSAEPPRSIPGILREPRKMNTSIPTDILPHERVFPIQIGTELFKLSGASLSSDAPSYFSRWFQCQLKQNEEKGEPNAPVRTLYIDRDPATFRDICLHLQGYHIQPKDGFHFVKLFADAQFYSLPRLISQLYEENLFISIGGQDFQIPREIFSDPGNSPNYFSLGFAMFFTTPKELFPGLERDGLLRPPSILPPSVPNRSPEIFAEILHLLRGYPIHIRNEDHRAELIRDCRYFHLKGLEQRLIRHHIGYNLARQKREIIIRIEDVRQSGISVVTDARLTETSGYTGWVSYARPFVDDEAYELVLEIGDECTKINPHTMRAEFFGDGKARITRLFEVVATKLNLPTTQPLGLLMAAGGATGQPASPGNTPLSEDQVQIEVGSECHTTLNGQPYNWFTDGLGTDDEDGVEERSISSSSAATPVLSQSVRSLHGPPRKRRREMSVTTEASWWIVRTGQWRLRVQLAPNTKAGMRCILVATKLDASSSELGHNMHRPFLG